MSTLEHDLREDLADSEHERWSRWMSYLFSKGQFNGDGSFTIEAESVIRWMKQSNTSYVYLSEKEKDSDRKEADRTIAILREIGLI